MSLAFVAEALPLYQWNSTNVIPPISKDLQDNGKSPCLVKKLILKYALYIFSTKPHDHNGI